MKNTMPNVSNRSIDIIKKKNPNLIPALIRENPFDVILLDMNFSAGIQTGNEGIFWMNKILEQDPKNLDALNNVGVVYTQFGKFEDAITKLEIAVKLDSSKARIWSNLSEVYRRAGNYHKANVCRMRAIQLNEKK